MITFKRGEVIKLPLKRKKGRVFIEPELAGNIIPNEIRPGLSLASVTGELEVKDNVYTIKVCTFSVLFNPEIGTKIVFLEYRRQTYWKA